MSEVIVELLDKSFILNVNEVQDRGMKASILGRCKDYIQSMSSIELR